MELHFTEQQQRTIASAVTAMALTVLVVLFFFIARGMLAFLNAFSGVLMPLATAFVLSTLLRPAYQALDDIKWIPSPVAVTIILLGLALPFVLLFWIFGGLILRQLSELIAALPAMWDDFILWLSDHAPVIEAQVEQLGGKERLQEWAQKQSDALVSLIAGGAQGLWTALGSLAQVFGWVVLPVYLIFMLMAPQLPMDRLEEFLPFLKEKHRKDVVFLVKQFVEIVVAFFRGQLIIAFAQGILMAIGFSLSGLSYGFVLGLLLGILNLVPYLGNMVGLSVTLPLAMLQPEGGLPVLIGVVITISVVQAVEAYILTPRIMGKTTGLHPMAVIFAMFFWGVALGGIFGLIMAIPLTAFLVVVWRLLKEKYFPAVEPSL
jgi:predicted PurR-regulated permease PerM